MLPRAFHDGEGPAISHGEPLAGASGNVKLAGRCAIEARVSYQDVASLRGFRLRRYGDRSSAESFADVIICFTEQTEVNSGDEKGAETLPGNSPEDDGMACTWRER